MSDPTRCPRCGSQLPDDAPRGLCPKCLVQAGFESEADPESSPRGKDPAVQPTMKSPAGLRSGFEPPPVEEIARLFPQLEILSVVGKGGMGAVYKARQPGLDRLVAIKILPPEISQDPTFSERFQREARALAKLNHPHIVAVYDFGQIAGLCYIVMEYVDGANLRQAIQTRSFTPAEALAVVPQICDALQFAHDEGIVHRDIKPENILIDKKGRVKIADFGLAKLLGHDSVDHSLTAAHQVMGTLRYMAPEQMQSSRAVDHRADIYSLGVVFYELLTGELPMGKFAPPSRRVQVDIRLDDIVLRALEQDPELRYQHASDVKTELDSIRLSAPVPYPPGAVNRMAVPAAAASMIPERLPGDARLSRCALVGACWAPLFFVMASASMITHVQHGEYTGPAWWQVALAITLLPLGALAPFGTTILGAVAIAQIRRSGGRLYGLGLAAADTLLFPLLLVFGVIAVVLTQAVHHLFPVQLVVAAVPSTIVAAIVCYSSGRAFWRAINPVDPVTVKRAVPAANSPAAIGLVSLWTAIASVVLPLALALLAMSLAPYQRRPEILLLCAVLGGFLGMVAAACGIAAKQTATGKAGMAVACVSLLLGLAMMSSKFSPGQILILEEQSATPVTGSAPVSSPPDPVYVPSTGWVMGPSGPALTDVFARVVLELQTDQIQQVNGILKATYAEYLTVEAHHTERTVDKSGHSVIKIAPFPEKIAGLENRLWTQLDAILDVKQQSTARLNLKLDPPEVRPPIALSELVRPGFFGWGKYGANLELWQVGTWHHWKVQTRGYDDSSRAPQLPEDYRRFWKDPAGDDTRIQGTWNYVANMRDGQIVDPDELKRWQVSFTNGEYTELPEDRLEKGTYKVDPSKSPKTIDCVLTAGPYKGLAVVGIYEMYGDSLKICWSPWGNLEHPKEFDAKPGSQRAVVILKRAPTPTGNSDQ